jgi:hypothetical protein
MNLSLVTTPEQDAALNALNLKSNPDGKTAVEDFAASLISDHLDTFVAQAKTERVNTLIQQIQSSKDTLTDEDIATLSTTIESKVNPGTVNPVPLSP